MATELLKKWANQDVGIPIPIQNFETDCANGYVFGQIMWKLRFITERDFDTTFVDSNGTNVLVQNFAKIGQVLNTVGIKFDAEHANQIMTQKPGAALRLAYQLKMAQSKHSNRPIGGEQKRTRLDQITLAALDMTQHRNRAFEKDAQRRLDAALLVTTNLNEKDKAMQMVLQKYDDALKDMLNQARADDDAATEARTNWHAENRNMLMSRIKANQQHLGEWEAKGKEVWKENILKNNARLQEEKRFVQTERARQYHLTQIVKEGEKTDALGVRPFSHGYYRCGWI